MRRVTPLAVALALVALAASGASGSTAEAPTRAVAIPGKAYEPPHLTVLVGTTVTWKNDDSITHTVTADGDAFSSGYVPPGGSFSFTFASQGHYAFHCTIHRFMKGEVDVFGLVLTGPEGPVSAGQRVVFAGLALRSPLRRLVPPVSGSALPARRFTPADRFSPRPGARRPGSRNRRRPPCRRRRRSSPSPRAAGSSGRTR